MSFLCIYCASPLQLQLLSAIDNLNHWIQIFKTMLSGWNNYTKSDQWIAVCLVRSLDSVPLLYSNFPRSTLVKRFVQRHSWHIITDDEQFIKLENEDAHVSRFFLSLQHSSKSWWREFEIFFRQTIDQLLARDGDDCDGKFTYHSDLTWKFLLLKRDEKGKWEGNIRNSPNFSS